VKGGVLCAVLYGNVYRPDRARRSDRCSVFRVDLAGTFHGLQGDFGEPVAAGGPVEVRGPFEFGCRFAVSCFVEEPPADLVSYEGFPGWGVREAEGFLAVVEQGEDPHAFQWRGLMEPVLHRGPVQEDIAQRGGSVGHISASRTVEPTSGISRRLPARCRTRQASHRPRSNALTPLYLADLSRCRLRPLRTCDVVALPAGPCQHVLWEGRRWMIRVA
jgi:hypothetical protein